MGALRIRAIRTSDSARWGELRAALWPDDQSGEISAYFRGELEEPVAVMVAEIGEELIAVVELSIRTDVPGAIGERVGFVEGLYVEPVHRNRGVALASLREAKRWSHAQSCAVIASDRAGRFIVVRGPQDD